MHIQTHILSGWCIANLLPFQPRQRAACMIAAAIADVDGFGLLFPGSRGQKLYWDYHHVLGHNLLFGILISLILMIWCHRQLPLTFLACLGLFHLHLLMDYWGSGRDWHIHYLWPISRQVIKNPHGWEFYSWQNMLTFALLFTWTIAIARWQQRTPLELPMPRLDNDLVRWGSAGKKPI